MEETGGGGREVISKAIKPSTHIKLAAESQLYAKINIQVHIFQPHIYFINKSNRTSVVVIPDFAGSPLIPQYLYSAAAQVG